jgi:hypothetical protein
VKEDTMRPSHPSVLAVGILVAGLAVAACGGSAASVTPATNAPEAATQAPTITPSSEPTASPASPSQEAATSTTGRTGRVELTDDKVAITLPDGWTEVVLSADDIDTILGNYPAGTFSEDQLAMMKAAVGAGMKLMAFDSDGMGSNVNLLVTDAAVPISLLAPTLEAQLAQIPGASGVKIEETKVDGVDAIKATYDLDQTMADGTSVNMTGTQLYASANGKLYVLTVTLADGSGRNPDDILSTVDFLD